MRKALTLTAATLLACVTLTGCNDSERESPPQESPIDAAVRTALVSDAQNVARGLTEYQAENTQYPQVPAAQLPQTLGTPLSSGDVVQAYSGSKFCVVHTISGAWLVMDAATGSNTTPRIDQPSCQGVQ